MNFLKFFLFYFFIHLSAIALEVDEKLTLRILEVSATKKTVLVNRGLEDGLVVGDHAKFFLTKGVIARGVVVKASPSRSIWSIYRIIDAADIEKNNVVNIKISTEVKLTDDPTKSVNAILVTGAQTGEPDSINLKSKKEDSDEISSLISDKEFSAETSDLTLVEKSKLVAPGKSNHGLEIYSLLSFNSYSGTYSSADADYDAASSNLSFTLGVEKYFPSSTGFFKNLSIKAHYSASSQSTGSTLTSSASFTDIGAGVSYYFGSGPFRTNDIMYFVDGNFGISSSTVENTVGTSDTVSLSGSGTFLSLGIGAKYLMNKEFGAILKLDYYKAASSFEVQDSTTNEITSEELSIAGPRVLFGLSYRFL